jgi:hypothetical protein
MDKRKILNIVSAIIILISCAMIFRNALMFRVEISRGFRQDIAYYLLMFVGGLGFMLSSEFILCKKDTKGLRE